MTHQLRLAFCVVLAMTAQASLWDGLKTVPYERETLSSHVGHGLPPSPRLRRTAVASAEAGQTVPVKAQMPKKAITPVWTKGILPISRESYWNAVECGKQGGERPLCVFYDAGLCPNPDFTLALYTPYKQVAYEVWQAVHRKQAAPTPSYVDAQKTRITLGITPVAGSKNPITAAAIKRGGRVVEPATRSVDDTGGRFIFDFAAFAPTEDITIDLIGRARTQSCLVERAVLTQFR